MSLEVSMYHRQLRASGWACGTSLSMLALFMMSSVGKQAVSFQRPARPVLK